LKKVEAFQQAGELRLPKNYSPENALKSAQLMLSETTDKNGKAVMESCSRTSIANALLKTVVWGLSPNKGQVYFIPYAGKLECSVSYTGNIAIAKRYAGLKRIKANCVMKGDDFEFEVDNESGRKKIVHHKQTLESIGSEKIEGAYAVYELEDGTIDVEIMSFSQISKSWDQRQGNGLSPAHKNFPDQMAMKTVLNRACKLLVRTSDDSILYDDEDKNIDHTKEDVKHDVKQNANKDTIDIDDVEYEEVDDEVKSSEKTPESKDKTFEKPAKEKSENQEDPNQAKAF
jgi:recombination protein RecT